EDSEEVKPVEEPKSISTEHTLRSETSDRETIEQELQTLASDLFKRLETTGMTCRTVGIKVVCSDFRILTRDKTVRRPINSYQAAVQILHELALRTPSVPVRKVGVRLSGLERGRANSRNIEYWTEDSVSSSINR
ncbi:MAG: hypothetical protein QXI37_00480, partial [Thermoprotei archaeon]